MSITLFVGGLPGGPELLIIVAIIVLLFGASKLPKLARSMGSATGEFKKGRAEVEQELEEIQDDDEAATESDTDTDPDPEPERDIEGSKA